MVFKERKQNSKNSSSIILLEEKSNPINSIRYKFPTTRRERIRDFNNVASLEPLERNGVHVGRENLVQTVGSLLDEPKME